MRLRLLLSFALIVLVSVTSVVLIARRSTANEVRAFMFRGDMVDVQDVLDALQDHYRAHGSWSGVEAVFSGLLPGQGRGKGQGHGGMMGQASGMMNQRLRLADADGYLVVDSSASQPEGRLSSTEKDAAYPIEVDGATVGYLAVEGGMGYNQSDELFLLGRLNQAALTAGLIAGGLAMLLALYLAYRLLRPVRALTQAAERLGQGDLSQRVRVRGDDELAMLGRTFNHMAASLQHAEESRRAMTADIAHELRNPLAVQRANLEALQDGVYLLTPENLEPVIAQNLLLTRLVEDLRTLALAESGQLKLECVPTDMFALAERAVERFRPQADAHQLGLRLQRAESLAASPQAFVDPMRVEQILSNLLSNALRYTPEEGQIDLEIEAREGDLRLSVRDNGPGIPDEALPHVFERFYRADKSRSRAQGGTGLGLAIARQLAEAHGGSLTAANHPRGGAVFELILPLQAKPARIETAG